jgi:uncharacterized protein DUF4158
LGHEALSWIAGVVGVATRNVFSAEELARLRGSPEITRAELIRYFTLTGPDVAFLRKFHSRVNVLGAGVQLCSLPWLGFVPDEVTAAPAAAVGRLAERLDIPAGELAGYGHRGQSCVRPARPGRMSRCLVELRVAAPVMIVRPRSPRQYAPPRPGSR